MKVEITTHDKAVVVAVSGRLDANTAAEFELELQNIPASSRLILDLADTAYVSSAGLRCVLAAGKRAKATGGSLELAGLGGSVREVFEISGFLSIFSTHESAAAALAV